MTNQEIAAAWEYHNGTKHSYQSVRSNPHFMDWSNRPRTYKIYRDLDPIALPREVAESRQPALSVLGPPPLPGPGNIPVTLEDLATTLSLSGGITRRRKFPGEEVLFRAAACTGALYSIELYAVCGDLKNLEAGIYHFSVHDFSLRRVRAGDYRGVLVHAAAGESAVTHAPVTLVCTGTYWRNAWKYQARTYRHFGWDNGTIIANLLAVATAGKLPVRIVNGFVDEGINCLLDLDVNREVALNLVPLGYSARPLGEQRAEVPPLHLETVPYSHHEIDYAAMRKIHAASSLTRREEVAAWRGNAPRTHIPPPSRELIPLVPFLEAEAAQDTIREVILRRGSARRFLREPITFGQFSTALARATQGVPADFLEPYGAQLNDLYVVAHAVDGLAPGSYFMHRGSWQLELLQEGHFRTEAGYLGLEQELPADCSAAVFLLTDLNAIFERFGNRGYRAAQLEAGIIAGRLYLAMYAQRLGATGLTFYDDEVTRFFSPHAAGKSAMLLVALGIPARQSRL